MHVPKFSKTKMILLALIAVVKAKQACDGTETCKLYFDEVCASDGKTYINECVFNKVKCFVNTGLR